jgi:hypothetical protein
VAQASCLPELANVVSFVLPTKKWLQRKIDNFAGATPRERETCSAMAIVVNDGPTVAKVLAFEANA